MAMFRYGRAEMIQSSVSTEDWLNICSVCSTNKNACDSQGRVKIAKSIFAKYSPEKYLLSHATIVAGLVTENAYESKSEFKDYLIHPAFSKLVNNNGDAWTNQMIAASYKTFIGANNYQEHIQIPELSKGKVIDAVLREVPIAKDEDGKDLVSYYVDILVATDRKHKELIAGIENGSIRFLSMGCKISFSICSKCGNKAVDETQSCQHVRYEKNSVFVDEMGITRKVAELCGHASIPDSVIFVDASWVANPAFTGAVRRSTVAPSPEIMTKLKEANQKPSYELKESDFLKVAQSEENISEEEPMVPEESVLPPEPVDPVKKWKLKIKEKILDELSDEILQELSDEEEKTGPRELETLDETLIQPTASKVMKQLYWVKKSLDKYVSKKAKHLDKRSSDKLKHGLYILLTSNDLTALKNYGYNRRDFLAVMSFLDECFKTPLAKDVKIAVSKIDGISGREPSDLIKDLVWYTGRRLTAQETNKALMWLRAMEAYPR